MALGATTYKTPNIINKISEDLTGREGCGVFLAAANTVQLAASTGVMPYGIIVTGTDSLTPGDYSPPSSIGDASLELVDQLGCVVQVLIGTNGNVTAGDFLLIDSVDGDGTFASTGNQAPAEGDWIWGLALTDAASSEQCLMRFQPQSVEYIAPPPAP
jgi:hypothetical protein